MNNWREKIEAQIAHLRRDVPSDPRIAGSIEMVGRWKQADTLQALLDVAVAAEGVSWPGPALERALDKLREVGDD